MLRRHAITFISAAILFVASTCFAQESVPSSLGPYAEAIITARTAIWKDINSGRASSATVAIMDNGEIVYAEGFGMADRERSIPVDPRTRFNIGSVSKVFDAVAIVLLVDEGKVELDAPVTRYLPEFKMADPRYNDITVRMLLDHTSGLPGTAYVNNFGYAYNPQMGEETLDVLLRAHLRHAPGAMAVYTNDGFTLAELIVERVSGQRWLDFLEERVFAPLSLTHTGASVGEDPDKPAAAYYRPDTAKKEPLEVLSVLGAGGLGSTASDLVRFADTFSEAGNKIFAPSGLREMRTHGHNPYAGQLRNPDMPYGLGWDMTEIPRYEQQGVQVLGKSGGTFHYTSMLYTAPDHRVSVAVIEAGQGANAADIALRIMDAVLVEKGIIQGEPVTVSRPLKPEPIPEEYRVFEGYYVGDEGALVRVRFDMDAQQVVLSMFPDGGEVVIGVLDHHQGTFYDPQTAASSYFTTIEEDSYYVTHHMGIDVIRFQKLPPVQPMEGITIDAVDRVWLRRNVRPYEAALLSELHVLRPRTIEDLPGYIEAYGIKRIESPTYAGLAVPAIRDQTELTLFSHEGETWMQISDALYSSAEGIETVVLGEHEVMIGQHAYSEWLQVEQDAILTFDVPAGGRVILFSPQGEPVWDNIVDTGDVFAEAGGFVEVAGVPGDRFRITAK